MAPFQKLLFTCSTRVSRCCLLLLLCVACCCCILLLLLHVARVLCRDVVAKKQINNKSLIQSLFETLPKVAFEMLPKSLVRNLSFALSSSVFFFASLSRRFFAFFCLLFACIALSAMVRNGSGCPGVARPAKVPIFWSDGLGSLVLFSRLENCQLFGPVRGAE